tara:strand:- start:227 stop:688 length:462 start_codon:yes stop_codon:yes gene_type:complete
MLLLACSKSTWEHVYIPSKYDEYDIASMQYQNLNNNSRINLEIVKSGTDLFCYIYFKNISENHFNNSLQLTISDEKDSKVFKLLADQRCKKIKLTDDCFSYLLKKLKHSSEVKIKLVDVETIINSADFELNFQALYKRSLKNYTKSHVSLELF